MEWGTWHTLGERGLRVIGLDVGLRDVVADADRDESLEGRLKFGVHVDRLLHSIVIDLVGEDNCSRLHIQFVSQLAFERANEKQTYSVESTIASSCDQRLVVGIDLRRCGAESSGAHLPVVSVIFP